MESDIISRQKAIDAVSKACEELRGVFGRCEDAIKALPYAQSDRKKGKWIHGKEIAREYIGGGLAHIEYEDCHCSECGYTVKRIRWNVDGELVDRYCSFCGADMREESKC